MEQLIKKHKIMFPAAVLLAMSVFAYVFFYNHIQALRGDLVTQYEQLAVLQLEGQQTQATIALLQDTEIEREELVGYFLALDDPTPLLELVETLAQGANVVLEVESLTKESGATEDAAGVTDSFIRAVVAVSGEWSNIYHLITLFELMPYVATVDKTVLTQIEGGSVWEGQVHLHVGTRTK